MQARFNDFHNISVSFVDETEASYFLPFRTGIDGELGAARAGADMCRAVARWGNKHHAVAR